MTLFSCKLFSYHSYTVDAVWKDIIAASALYLCLESSVASRTEILRDCVESNLLKAMAGQKLLPAIKVLTDWLRLNAELVTSCVEVGFFFSFLFFSLFFSYNSEVFIPKMFLFPISLFFPSFFLINKIYFRIYPSQPVCSSLWTCLPQAWINPLTPSIDQSKNFEKKG